MTAKNKTERNSGLAIAGLVVAICALVLSWVPILNNVMFFVAVISLILGIAGLISIKKGKRVGQGLAVSTIVISIAAIGVVFATQALYVKVIDDVGESVNESMNDFTGENTDKLLENTVGVELGEFVFDQGEEIEYSYDDTTELPVTVTNKSEEKSSFSVMIEAVDAEGVRIADDTVYVSELNPGQSINEKAFSYVEEDKVEALRTAEFKIVQVTK